MNMIMDVHFHVDVYMDTETCRYACNLTLLTCTEAYIYEHMFKCFLYIYTHEHMCMYS